MGSLREPREEWNFMAVAETMASGSSYGFGDLRYQLLFRLKKPKVRQG